MKKFMSIYQGSNPEKFNDDFIYMKKNDNILQYIDDMCKALEVINGVKYLGGTLNTDESTFSTKLKNNTKYLSIQESRLNLVTIKFEISGTRNKDNKLKTDVIELKLFVPKLVDDFYFILNNSRYYPIYQIIDEGTYYTKNAINLRTLLMRITVGNKLTTYTSSDGIVLEGYKLFINLFRYKVNFYRYYLVEYGLAKTLELFDLKIDDDFIIQPSNVKDDMEGYKLFRTSYLSLYIREDIVLDPLPSTKKDLLVSLIDCFYSSKCKYDNLYDQEFWIKKLGSNFTKSTDIETQVDKTNRIIISFKRILDERTKKTLRIDDEYKDSTFGVIRWMILNYRSLSRMDSMDINTKRIRVYEYLIHPLLLKFSDSTYRLLNSKSYGYDQIRTVFSNIKPGFIIKTLINNELLRYSNAVNHIDLYTSALKWSLRGPQSISEGGKSVAIRYMDIHPSYIGKIGLTTASSGDPGLSGTFTPFIKTNGFYFSDKFIIPNNDNYDYEDEVIDDLGSSSDEEGSYE